MQKNKLNKILLLLVGFSAGALFGGAFLHLIPESLNSLSSDLVGVSVMLGFALFFIIERVLRWNHCHKYGENCEVHSFKYLNLIGDGIHNFIDGLIIATSFVVDFKLGIATTLAVVIHELPQEISDFGVLVYGGFSRKKALLFNFLSALIAILGVIIGFFLSSYVENISSWLLPFAAGGFIYIAASDLVPELHKEHNIKKSFLSFFLSVLGVLFMWLMKQVLAV